MREYDFATFRVFTDLKNQFYGNVSTVVFLKKEPTDIQMQRMAKDFAQPATTFLWKKELNKWNVRWFAPDQEIQLCGHGTMAAMAFITNNFHNQWVELDAPLHTVHGGRMQDGMCYIELDPIPVETELDIPDYLEPALGIPVVGYYQTNNKNIVLTDCESSVRNMQPDYALLRTSKTFGYAVTARGDKADFVSRTLVPHVNQLEDPATGSSHAALVPFWADILGQETFKCLQLSDRGGKFTGSLMDGKVKLTGCYQKINQGNICSL